MGCKWNMAAAAAPSDCFKSEVQAVYTMAFVIEMRNVNDFYVILCAAINKRRRSVYDKAYENIQTILA